MNDTVLATERLILRRWRDSDFEEWFAHLNTPEVRAHLGKVDSRESLAARIERVKASLEEKGYSFLAVERREDGMFLGACGIADMTSEWPPEAMQGAPEIGWQLRADCWGNGYATEAARAVLAMAFEQFAKPVVYSQTSEANVASWKVMERLGMERMPQLDYDDPDYPAEENPTKVYALTREAWQARRDA